MARASFSQSFRIFEEMPVDCRHGVEAKQFQAQGAKVNALHRPVMHSRGAEGAAVAAAIVQNAPCVAELIAIFPNRVEDIFVSVGMLLVEAVGNEADVFLAGGAVSARVLRHREILHAAKMGLDWRAYLLYPGFIAWSSRRPLRLQHSNLAFRGNNETSSPLADVFPLKQFPNPRCQISSIRRTQTYQQNAAVRTRSKPARVRKIQVLRDQKSRFFLRRFPNLPVCMPNQPFFMHCMDVVT